MMAKNVFLFALLIATQAAAEDACTGSTCDVEADDLSLLQAKISQDPVDNVPYLATQVAPQAAHRARDAVRGLITAFFQLQPGEEKCLQHNLKPTGSIVPVTMTFSILINDLRQNKGDMDLAGLASAIEQMGMQIASLVDAGAGLAEGCVHGDALETLKTTSQYIKGDGSWRESGDRIRGDLADAVDAFAQGEYYTCGHHIGTALRKVLLSNSNTTARLLEHVRSTASAPKEKIKASA